MPTRTLPVRPNLDQLRRQVAELRRQLRESDPSAAARIAAHHPGISTFPANLKLADAQLVIAREYGFESWARLKHHVELGDRVAAFRPHPRFDEALAAMDAGDLDRLRGLLKDHPDLVHARTNLEPPYHYFTGATLLHHVAGNPDRGRNSGELGPMPDNLPEVARLLLDAGAEVDARTLGPNGGTTMGLLLTSHQASLADMSGPLIDLLLEYGAKLDVTAPDALVGPLVNHAPRAAERMIELGAKPDLFAVAALGRLDLVREAFDANGSLRARQRRNGRALSARDAIGLAMLVAYVRKQHKVVDFLLERNGNWDVTGVNNGTALHRAACEEDLEMVQRLVAKGADVGNRDNPFVATPLSWAHHFEIARVVDWMRAHCRIDLHDAVSFGFREQVEARLRENPAGVNERRDQWTIPQATPLHLAAVTKRADMADLLLRHGADASLRAGNGLTVLDMAEQAGAGEVVDRIRQVGGS
ncbi:MAG: ankyrin repeat domain-containing protein [Fimbriimonas sp.]